MKTSLCSFCLKSGMLCPKCQAKLRSGEISEIDLKIARLLLSLENDYPSLQNVYFHKAIEVNGTLALVVGQGDMARVLGYGGKIIRTLGEKTGKNVRVLEYGADERKFLEDLFAPLGILTINTIWLPDGTTETRVILRKVRGRMPRLNVKALKQIAQKVRGMTLRIEFTD